MTTPVTSLDDTVRAAECFLAEVASANGEIDSTLGDDSGGKGVPRFNVDDTVFQEARERFLQTIHNHQLQEAERRHDQRFYGILALSVAFLCAVVLISYLMVDANQQVSTTLGASAGVLVGYLLLIRAFLKHQETIWENRMRAESSGSLLRVFEQLGPQLSPDQFIRIAQMLRSTASK